jgi:integrase
MVGLHKHPKNGGYWFKRGIPERLRPFFPDRGQTWNENLKTKDPDEARLRCLEVARRVEALFQQAEAQRSQAAQRGLVDVGALECAVADWKRRELAARAEAVVHAPSEGWDRFWAEWKIAEPTQFAASEAAHSARQAAHEVFVERAMNDLLEQAALLLVPDHPARRVVRGLVERAWVEVLGEEGDWRNRHANGLTIFEQLPESDAPTAPEPVQVPALAMSRSADAPRLTEALESWKSGGAHDAKVPRPRTALEATTAVRRFVEAHGDLPIHAIQKRHARELRDLLARVPTTLAAKQRELPIRKLAALELDGPRPTAQTLNKQMNLLSAVLSNADRDGHFDGVHWSNPFRLQLRLADEATDSFEPFTAAELKKLVASPVFARGERPRRGRGETAKWAPLMALFHGMRRGEVLQLLVDDVRQEEGTGVWFLDVSPEEASQKRVKNRGSKRRVAIHAHFVKLGFLEFVEERRRSVGGSASLWPGFEDRSKLASRSNNWAEWFHRYLAEHVIDADTKKFHSFRGAFKRFGEESASPAIIKRIMGHALVGVSDTNYGRLKDESGERDHGVSLQRMAAEIAKVSFGGVDFAVIK